MIRAMFVGAAAWLAACRTSPAERTWAMCACEYMTDRDQPGTFTVESCGEPSVRENLARACALNAGVGVVLGCKCGPSGSACRDRDGCREPR